MKVITIGRSQENDIVINDEKVSRHHLQIVQSDSGSYSVVDLGSTNGTYVNGQRITGEAHLQPNDTVQIGNTTLPWQTYFMAQQPFPPRKRKRVEIEDEPSPKPNRTASYIAAAVVALLIIGGVIAFIVFTDRGNAETPTQHQEGVNQEDAEAIRLLEEAERLWDEALRLEVTDREAAEQARREAEAAQQRADAARIEAATRAAEDAARAATEAARAAEAERARREAEAARAETEEAARQRAERDRRAVEDALRAQQEAEERMRLTTDFFRDFAQLNYARQRTVITRLGLQQPPLLQRQQRGAVIQNAFEQADNNARRREIIAIIRDVLGAPPEPDPDDDSDDENNENGNSNDTENATENLSEAMYLRTLPNGVREYRLPSGATKRIYPGGAIRLTPPQTQ